MAAAGTSHVMSCVAPPVAALPGCLPGSNQRRLVISRKARPTVADGRSQYRCPCSPALRRGGAPGVPLAPPICAEHGDDSATGEEYPACAVWRQGAQVHVKTDDVLHFIVDLGNKTASELRLRTFV